MRVATSVTTEIISKGIDLIGQIVLYSRSNAQDDKFKEETRGDAKSRIDRLQEYIDEELAKMKTQRDAGAFPAQASARPVEQTNGKQDALIDRSVDRSVDVSADSSQGLAPHQGKGIGQACLPCTRAHLITVRGTLKEALRFALGESEGVNHPEVTERLETAAEELTVMERFDLSPEKVASTTQEERIVINQLLPKLRDMRQQLLNGVDSPEHLQELASTVGEIYNQVRTSTQAGVDWDKVDQVIAADEK
jgi:hypothetical protein